MRVAPIGLIGLLLGSPTAVFELAAETAALTHGHATGYLAAGHLAVMIASLTAGGDPIVGHRNGKPRASWA